LGSWVSGLYQLTVNQPLRQRWFESITTHHIMGLWRSWLEQTVDNR